VCVCVCVCVCGFHRLHTQLNICIATLKAVWQRPPHATDISP